MKKLMMALGVISILAITGCDSDIFNTVDNFLKNNNSAVESADSRSVEGHIQNIDYALLQEEMKGNSDKFDNLTTYDEIVNALKTDGIYLPANDYIRCESYKISRVQTQEAKKCTDMGEDGKTSQWADRKYSITKGGHAYRDDD